MPTQRTKTAAVDRQSFFTALAFLAISIRGGDEAGQGNAQSVHRLAELMEEFCAAPGEGEQSQNTRLLHEAMAALEQVLEDGKLTFSSEQAADAVVGRIRKKIG